MLKKIVFIALLMAGAGMPLLQATPAPVAQEVKAEIPEATLVYIYHYLAKEGYCTYDQAKFWYETGQMTIEEVKTGVYRVVLPSGGVIILDIDTL